MRGALLVAGGFLAGAAGLFSGAWCGPAGPAEAAAPESIRVGAVDMQAVILQSARGQRAWNRQPTGGSSSPGGLPGMPDNRLSA